MSEGVVGCSSSVRSADIAAASVGWAVRRVTGGLGKAEWEGGEDVRLTSDQRSAFSRFHQFKRANFSDRNEGMHFKRPIR